MSRESELERIIAAQPGVVKNGRWKIDPRLGVSIIGWIATLAISWGVSWSGFSARVSVLESAQQMMKERQHETDLRLQRLEDKLDTLLRRP